MAIRKIREIIGMIGHPKGSILYTTSEVYPGDYIGGTWIKIENCFLTAMNLYDSSGHKQPTYNNAIDGGSANAINVAHTHAAAATHNHTPSSGDKYGFLVYTAEKGVAKRKTRPATGEAEMYVHTTPHGDDTVLGYIYSWESTTKTSGAPTNAVSGTGKNMPKYRAVYIWLRTGW